MILERFHADADVWGRRVWLNWSFRLASNEAPANIPRVRIWRKERDFEYRRAGEPQPDPAFQIYDSGAFPSPGLTLHAGALSARRGSEARYQTNTESALLDGAEVLRRVIETRFENDRAVSVNVRLLDSSPGLVPLTPYYYQLDAVNFPGQPALENRRASATPTERHNIGRKLWEMLPEIYRRHDPLTPSAPLPYPESAGSAGPLRRFIDLFGAPLDHLRTQAEGLRNLRDTDHVDARYLPLLARWIGWDLQLHSTIPLQRHEIRYAPALYRITGTIPGCMMWVKRLTTWNNRIKEFGRNVFFSNDTGNPDDPTDKGSLSVDTDNPAILAAIKSFDDELDYTYDTGEAAWYAYDTIGIFLEPPPDAAPAEVDRVCMKLRRNLTLFLPTNIRGVIVLDLPQSSAATGTGVNLLGTEVN